jgi:hypothetical protein
MTMPFVAWYPHPFQIASVREGDTSHIYYLYHLAVDPETSLNNDSQVLDTLL